MWRPPRRSLISDCVESPPSIDYSEPAKQATVTEDDNVVIAWDNSSLSVTLKATSLPGHNEVGFEVSLAVETNLFRPASDKLAIPDRA